MLELPDFQNHIKFPKLVLHYGRNAATAFFYFLLLVLHKLDRCALVVAVQCNVVDATRREMLLSMPQTAEREVLRI